jgi:wyosine [tRNA(Phe)-imidazoG37] synthetase (radical SAM superfamily)
MATFLFDSIIFGPVWSRRLGESLGINLLPVGQKFCNFNCIYCECGLTPESMKDISLPDARKVGDALENKLIEMKSKGSYLNAITFAGNGEPTLHPNFPEIIEDSIQCRDRYFPEAKIAVLSNSTLVQNQPVFNALLKTDLNILKLDSAIESTLKAINCPGGSFRLHEIIDALKRFQGKLIIQTLFLKGTHNEITIDNTAEEEIRSWLSILDQVRPESVMIYSLARDTAVSNLKKVGEEALNRIAKRVEQLGIPTQISP